MRYRAALRPDAVKQLVSIIFFDIEAQAENEKKMHKSGTNGMKWRFAEQKSREKSRNVLLTYQDLKLR